MRIKKTDKRVRLDASLVKENTINSKLNFSVFE